MKKFYSLLLTVICGLLFVATACAYEGKIIDAKTKDPIAGAVVTLNDVFVRTGKDGTFKVQATGETLKVRAPGYAKQELTTATLKDPIEIALTPFKVKALYLSSYGVASHSIRNAALKTMRTNKMNAFVIDVKGDQGFIPFKTDIALAKTIGAQKRILLKDPAALIAKLKQQNIYLIARIVVFKDDLLAQAKPALAVKKGGSAFRDREKLRWVDPFQQEAWNYNIAIAKAAAELGFDEIQFDYVRFPDTKGLKFSQPSTIETRTKAITGFLTAAQKALAPYNVMLAADIFGYVPWNENDTFIGQDINKVTNSVDIVSLMLYPSGFQFGIPKYRNPVKHSYEIVHLSLKRAQERTKVSAARFRPWLQAFHDYAFHSGAFANDRLHMQVKATEDFGSSGYMFWNPRNVYAQGKFD